MLKFIRQFQTGILIIIAIVVAVAFSMLDGVEIDWGGTKVGDPPCTMKVDGRCYQETEIAKLLKFYQLTSSRSFIGMQDFVQTLSNLPINPDPTMSDQPTNFVANLLVLRGLGKQLEIEPSAEEIDKASGELIYFDSLETSLENMGLSQAGFSKLVRDFVIFKSMRALVGAGGEPVEKIAENEYILSNRRYTASKVLFKKDNYKDEVKISEEQIQQYFDERNNQPAQSSEPAEQTGPIANTALLTDEKRSFNYIQFSPEEIGDEVTEADKRTKRLDFVRSVNSYYNKVLGRLAAYEELEPTEAMVQQKKAFLETAKQQSEAAENQGKIVTGEFADLSRDNLPLDFSETPKPYFELFKETFQAGDISVPFETNSGNFYIVQLVNIVPPRNMTLEEARPTIIEALELKALNKIVSDSASEAKTNLQEALKAGKSITEAAADNNLQLESLPEFSAVDLPEEIQDRQLILTVSELSSGEISKVVDDAEGAYLVHVNDITIYENEDREEQIKKIAEQTAKGESNGIFNLWFREQVRKANPQYTESMWNVLQRAN